MSLDLPGGDAFHALSTIRAHRSPARTPLATVSGVASTNPQMLDWFARHTCVAVVTTKSIEVEPNAGNREPVIVQPRPGCFGNAVGLRNPGLTQAARGLAALRKLWDREPPQPRPLLNVSLSASCAGDFARLASRLGPIADMLELNLSCPHAAAGFGAAIGSDAGAIEDVTRAAVAATDAPVFVKLTPNVEDIGAMAVAAVKAGAHGIVAINTVGPVTYVLPGEDEPVLSVPGGRGGMSGEWIHGVAQDAVRRIRRAIGPEIVLIGMGGVTAPAQVARMCAAGADIVGVGSVLATVHQAQWPAFLAGLSRGGVVGPCAGGTAATRGSETRMPRNERAGELPRLATMPDGPPQSAAPVATAVAPVRQAVARPGVVSVEETSMSWRRHTVRSLTYLDPTMIELVTWEPLVARPGQTVFLRIRGVGEKPFAVAACEPLTVLVKIKGPFTRALSSLRPGDEMGVRGPYGDPHRPAEGTRRAFLVAGGTGFAALSLLAGELDAAGAHLTVMLGLRDARCATPLAGHPVLRRLTEVVYDDGTVGAVLEAFAKRIGRTPLPAGTVVYTAGPPAFMERATSIALHAGLPTDRVFVVTERRMLCGVGLCGACSCGGRLTCQHGTIVTAREIEAERRLGLKEAMT